VLFRRWGEEPFRHKHLRTSSGQVLFRKCGLSVRRTRVHITLDSNELASSPRYRSNYRAVSCWGRWSEHLHAQLARPLPRVRWSFSAARQSVRRSAGRASHSCQDLAPEYVLGCRQRFARSGLVVRIISYALVSAWLGRSSFLRPRAFQLGGALYSAFPRHPGGRVKLLSNWSIDADAQVRPAAPRPYLCAGHFQR
jgi:hypothetical protein